MPRGGTKTVSKKPVPKRAPRKVKEDEITEEPPLNLEKFLVNLYDWPDVTDILATDAFKEALDQFSKVAAFRNQLKEGLAPCYGKKRMPRTPKKLVHKGPARPIPQTTRVIDFELNLNSDESAKSDVIAATGMVPQTPTSKLQAAGSNFKANKNTSAINTQSYSPFNRLCNVNPVIASTPTPNRVTTGPNATRNPMMQSTIGATQSPLYLNARGGAATMPASALRPILRSQSKIFPVQSTPKQPVDQTEQKLKLQQKLNDAEKRHEERIREQKERVTRDNEQRKRRVNLNLQAKAQEDERKREEQRMHQDRIRQFEEAQRTPKTPNKVATPAKVQTPSRVQTPRQKEVPQKRTKQNEPSAHYVVTPKPIIKPTQIPVPKPRPAVIAEPQRAVSVEVTLEESIVVEEEVIHYEEVSSTVVMAEEREVIEQDKEDEAATSNKENQEIPAPVTPVVKKNIKQDESAYEMTPDKVFQPSTENDYNVNDLSSGDETDNEDKPRKKVPSWAEKSTLRTNVQNLFRFVSKETVNSHFGVLKQPKITVLFANNNKSYNITHNETTPWDSPLTKF